MTVTPFVPSLPPPASTGDALPDPSGDAAGTGTQEQPFLAELAAAVAALAGAVQQPPVAVVPGHSAGVAAAGPGGGAAVGPSVPATSELVLSGWSAGLTAAIADQFAQPPGATGSPAGAPPIGAAGAGVAPAPPQEGTGVTIGGTPPAGPLPSPAVPAAAVPGPVPTPTTPPPAGVGPGAAAAGAEPPATATSPAGTTEAGSAVPATPSLALTDTSVSRPEGAPAAAPMTGVDGAAAEATSVPGASGATGATGATTASQATATPATSSPEHTTAVLQQVFPEVTRAATTQGNGTHRLTLTLQPEALGEVRVVLVVRDGEVHVSLAAEGTGQGSAHQALLQGAPELRRMLELAGTTDPRIVVRDAAGEPSADAGGQFREQLRDSGAQGREQARPQQTPEHRATASERPAAYSTPTARPVPPTPAGRLDRLM